MAERAERFLTTHTGSLHRPPDILEMLRAKEAGQAIDEQEFERRLTETVADNVRRQVEAGILVVNDGESGKPSFGHYIMGRLSGFEARVPPGGIPVPTGPIGVSGRDAEMFRDYYDWVLDHNPFENVIRVAPRVCVGPISYIGQAELQRDIANLKRAVAGRSVADAFMPAASPVWANRANEFYAAQDECVAAYADALREEYIAILDAGLLLQIDDPSMVSAWDGRRDWTLEEYRAWAEQRVETLNYALRDLPADRIRYHTCYGVNIGPRVSDLALEVVIDMLFKIRAGAYSFEAANPRHEHEWRLFETVKLPEGKVLIPGMVTQSNVMVEHPEVVADRIARWASVVGPENVIAGADCGFASTAGNSEIPPTVAWAKLQALGEGARLAAGR